MDRLIPMTDFVLKQLETKQSTSEFKESVKKYAYFLKTPLKLGMLTPCDENDNPLKPVFPSFDGTNQIEYNEYQQAEERVLIKGLDEEEAIMIRDYNDIIDNIVYVDLRLTDSAKKLFKI